MEKLNVKLLKLTAGKPIVIIHKKLAGKASIYPDERVKVEKGSKKVIAIVDTATGFLNRNEIIVSNEVSKKLKLKENDKVNVSVAPRPESVEIIKNKLEGHRINNEELKVVMKDIAEECLTDAEIAYFVSGVLKEGMSMRETANMIRAMVNSGKKLKLKGDIVDKHSIGGVPGRTSPIIVSICSAAGLKMPKTSSRAITSPAGTADAMETVCNVDFEFSEIEKIFSKSNSFLVWGGSLGLAPADDKIVQVEKLLSLDPTPQLLASIMSKKLAVNAKYILINIPYGSNAKVTKKEGEELKKKFNSLAKHFDVKIKCLLTRVREPYGKGIGPALEMKDVIEVLNREGSAHNLENKSVKIAGEILEFTGKAKKGKGQRKAKKILDSGGALKKFKEIVKNQGGKLNVLGDKDKIGTARYNKIIRANKSGKISSIDINGVNQIAIVAGCPLNKKAGLVLNKHLKDSVKKGEKLLTIYAESRPELNQASARYKKEIPIKIK